MFVKIVIESCLTKLAVSHSRHFTSNKHYKEEEGRDVI